MKVQIARNERPVLVAGLAIVAALALMAAGDALGAWASMLQDGLMVLAALVAGAGIAGRAGRALRRWDVSIDVLVTLAALGALAIGEYWEAAAVTFLFTFGHALEARTLRRTRRALGELLSLLPSEVRVLRDGEEHTLAPGDVTPGDVVVVRPGERIPVDGAVHRGQAGVDESTITGESMPVDKDPGAEVFTGTTAHGYLEVRAEAVGADTTLAGIVRRVEEAQEAKPARQRFLERFARYYTPGVVAGSAAAFAWTGDLHLALTLLVIACPGALVIATPVAMVAGIGRAARDGVLLKGGDALETLAGVDTVAFDKTGTLTRGRPVVREVVTPQASFTWGPRDEAGRELPAAVRTALTWAARAESGSEHPIATAIRSAAGPLPAARPSEFEAVAGGGTRARVEGREVRLGSAAFLGREGVDLGERALHELDALRDRGRTVAGVAVNGAFHAWIALADEVRPHAREALAALREQGVRKLVMLTGDHPRSARAVADELGLDEVHAELKPGAKQDLVEALAGERGLVAMVGDGVNDAPALARADVGIAMGAAGTRAALETAPVALMGEDLRSLPRAVQLARRTVRIVRQNLVIALATVLLLLAGVLAGPVNMAGGMLVHQASVLLVILNALRLSRSLRRETGASRAGRPMGRPAGSAA